MTSPTLTRRILYFIGFMLLQNFSVVILSVDQILGVQMSQLAYAIVISLVFLAVMVYFIRQYQHQIQAYNPRGFGLNLSMKGKISWIILTVVGVYIFLMVVTPLLPAGNAENQVEINKLFRQQALGITLYGAVLAPIIEELLYRGIFMNFFWNKQGRKYDILAVVTSGLLFGLLHEPQLSLYLLVYSGIGMAFGALYLKTRDIRCNMIAHILYNSVTFLAMFATM